uniref:hypothetical protein n=1 Tax=Enterocloster clostridioformis TaxID=1531 RepID=UPI001C3E2D0A|nr:hypothetical protein [Enterocloster clostridioformis]
MREEIYQIRRPDHILFGDPLCLEDKEHFKNVLVDYSPEKYFVARLVLKEEPDPEDKSFTLRYMNLYLAPQRMINVYMNNQMYKGQETVSKGIAVDTARYHIEVDDRSLDIHTGGDGWWGNFTEFYRMNGERKISDAVILTIYVPEEKSFTWMKQSASYLFEGLQPLEKNKKVPNRKTR